MTDVKLPQLGESIAEGTIGQWLVAVGETVEVDQPIVQVTTDKADVDIPSPSGGVLTEILVKEGTTVEVGTVIALIDETGKGAAKPSAPEPKKVAAPTKEPEPEKAVKPEPEPTVKPAPKPEKKPAVSTKAMNKGAKELPGYTGMEKAFRASEARQPTGAEAGGGGVPVTTDMSAFESPVEIYIREEGIPGEEAMKPCAPHEQITAPPEVDDGGVSGPCPNGDMSAFYSPAVMRLAIDKGVDLKGITGTGQCGRITKSDVLKAASGEPVAAPAPFAKTEAPAKDKPTAIPADEPKPESGYGAYRPPVYEVGEGDVEEPFSRVRRLIADHMVYSKRTAPHVTTFAEADMHEAVETRDRVKDAVLKEHGVKLTYLHFVMYAVAAALRDYPQLNSVVQSGNILTKKRIDMGVAVDTERGLMVPVIRDAGGMGIIELSKALTGIAERVRDRKITPDELTGGTVTVTNPGRKGNLFGTPIISQPQVAIVRMGEVVKKPVVVQHEGEDVIVIHPMMFVSLSYDHRAVDGKTSNEFLYRIREILEAGEFGL
jgi:2-oxoglutarate dehydrogenase E2 component (dihydrolipoamide succinyltransferase)